MKALLHNTFQVTPGERIQLVTTVDNPPFIAGFQTPPHGGNWASITTVGTKDTRTFVCPGNKDDTFTFFVSCDESIPSGAPYSVAIYTLSFSSLTNPTDPAAQSGINVPQGLGPISSNYTFIVTP